MAHAKIERASNKAGSMRERGLGEWEKQRDEREGGCESKREGGIHGGTAVRERLNLRKLKWLVQSIQMVRLPPTFVKETTSESSLKPTVTFTCSKKGPKKNLYFCGKSKHSEESANIF